MKKTQAQGSCCNEDKRRTSVRPSRHRFTGRDVRILAFGGEKWTLPSCGDEVGHTSGACALPAG